MPSMRKQEISIQCDCDKQRGDKIFIQISVRGTRVSLSLSHLVCSCVRATTAQHG